MRILYLSDDNTTFIRQDIAILRGLGHHVDVLGCRAFGDYVARLPQARGYDLYFCWWAHTHQAVHYARLYGGRSVLVAGGYEVALETELSYGYNSHSPLKRAITRWALRNADQIWSVSQYAYDCVEKIQRPRVHRLIYNAIDVSRFAFRPGPREPFAITIGRVDHDNILRKGFMEIVQAVPHVVERVPGFRFVFVGEDAGGVAPLQAEARRLGVEDRVSFTGFVDEKEKLELLQTARVYVQNSLTENFGVSMAEAMASGASVVCTGRAATREVIGECGLPIDHDDPRDIAAQMARLLLEDDLFREKQAAARARVVEHFSLEARVAGIERALASL